MNTADTNATDANRADENVPYEDSLVRFSSYKDSLTDEDFLPDFSSGLSLDSSSGSLSDFSSGPSLDSLPDSSEDTGLLDPQRVMPLTCMVADTVIALASVDSTNTFAADLVRSGGFPTDGDFRNDAFAVVCADTQTAGRGRLDHTWASSAGESFIVSFVASVPVPIVRDPSVCGWLQMSAGLAVLDAIRETCPNRSFEPQLKWPNDVFADGRKFGGILAEMVPIVDCDDRVAIVFGVGLNLAVPAERLPTEQAISLHMFADGLPDFVTLRDMLASRISRELKRRLRFLEDDPMSGARHCLDEMNDACWTIGKSCEAHFTDGSSLRGKAIRVNSDASLTIEDRRGALHRVTTADVGVLAD